MSVFKFSKKAGNISTAVSRADLNHEQSKQYPDIALLCNNTTVGTFSLKNQMIQEFGWLNFYIPTVPTLDISDIIILTLSTLLRIYRESKTLIRRNIIKINTSFPV